MAVHIVVLAHLRRRQRRGSVHVMEQKLDPKDAEAPPALGDRIDERDVAAYIATMRGTRVGVPLTSLEKADKESADAYDTYLKNREIIEAEEDEASGD